jgi:predicted XRE-type DNA-binding protein
MRYSGSVNTVREMARRPTRDEEARLLRAAQRLETATRTRAERQAELDQIVLEVRQANVRVADIADVLGVDRSRVYESINRAEHQHQNGGDAPAA